MIKLSIVAMTIYLPPAPVWTFCELISPRTWAFCAPCDDL
jgi:hypothetical protein